MSEMPNDGGPAFPLQSIGPDFAHGYAGMTLRDYFAAKAMHQIIAGAVLPPGFDATEQLAMAADRAYEIADALLKARQQ